MILKDRIDAFVAKANDTIAAYWLANDYTMPCPTRRAVYSDKWAKIVVVDGGRDTSVFCFVALQDFTNKVLGTVKAGDIHKAASFKAPAKTARGSVFADDFGDCLTPYGVKYLR